MRFLATSVLIAFSATQAAAAVPYAKLREVGERVSCQCGCAYTVGSCNMLNCHFRDPVVGEIREGLEAGRPEAEILEAIYAKYGGETRVEPRNEGFGMVGWIAPFAALLAGLAIIPWVVRRWRSGTVARSRGDAVPAAVVDQYRTRIEEDLDELD